MTNIELLKRCEKWLRYQVLGFTKTQEAEQLALLSDLVAAIAEEPKVVEVRIHECHEIKRAFPDFYVAFALPHKIFRARAYNKAEAEYVVESLDGAVLRFKEDKNDEG